MSFHHQETDRRSRSYRRRSRTPLCLRLSKNLVGKGGKVALFTQGIRASQERRRIHSPGEQCALETDNDFLIDAPPMFGGALLDSLVKFVRDALDRYAWHGNPSTDPIWNRFGTIISAVRPSVKCPTLDSTERSYLFSNGKMIFQSFFMSTTVQPFACASSSALSSRPMEDTRS